MVFDSLKVLSVSPSDLEYLAGSPENYFPPPVYTPTAPRKRNLEFEALTVESLLEESSDEVVEVALDKPIAKRRAGKARAN